MKKKEKTLIGTLDKIDFLDFALEDVPCKIDTGAKTSAIHCHKVKIIEKNGEETLSFQLLKHPNYKQTDDLKEFRISEFWETKVRSSSGQSEYRYVIKTKIKLFGKIYTTEFTLADRELMKFPVLLGKKLLQNRFLVDVSLKDLSYNSKLEEK